MIFCVLFLFIVKDFIKIIIKCLKFNSDVIDIIKIMVVNCFRRFTLWVGD